MVLVSEGDCCVCGKRTTQRCSTCGQHDDSIFFCSRQCQKLVWFAHKRVCGEGAKPFRYPLLSEAEVEQALKIVSVKKLSRDDDIVSTADVIASITKRPVDEASAVIHELQIGNPPPSTPPPPLTSSA